MLLYFFPHVDSLSDFLDSKSKKQKQTKVSDTDSVVLWRQILQMPGSV